ncbi:butyrate kinase [Pseudodesulfovibrio sp. JC047]|uniref:butyrate kinase n=1 Tax=Pseudodesulfovibrio sp. JC047 TaxID=2683199 RepID=UPI0013D29682|nr:butyrate kinase [Pseudodesulfovibrio sp. JC047]NDV20905.1 butyrate kinase [Pseudodesulfovibrio sp. JC047]
MSILVINPGSTSTKLAVYDGENAVATQEVQHRKRELAVFARVTDQFDFRVRIIRAFLDSVKHRIGSIRAVAGRGGLLHPLQGGVYAVCDAMAEDLRTARYGEHPCNLGGLLARAFGQQFDVPAYVVDPVVTDEMMDVARVTGLPAIRRRSLFHALNQRGMARIVAERLGIAYEAGNFIVCHMGGGISIGAHRRGRVVDVLNGLDGEGPMTPERTGGVPLIPVLHMIRDGAMSLDDMERAVLRRGGLFAHLGTNDPREIVARIEAGDSEAEQVFSAFAYAVARAICSMVPALIQGDDGPDVAAVILTGGLARSKPLMAAISRMVSHLGRVEVEPGEIEMISLAQGAQRVLTGEERVRVYVRERVAG